jgi:hypothetical protein
MTESGELVVLRSIDKKMDQVVKMLALSTVQGMNDDLQKMKTLSNLGLSSAEIGLFLGITGSAVRFRLTEQGRKRKKGKKNGK